MRTAADCQQLLDERRAERERLVRRLAEIDSEIAELEKQVRVAPRRGRGVRIPDSQARDAILELKEFSVPELAEYLSCSDAAARRFVEHFLKRGIIEFDRLRQVGVGRPAKVYRYVKPTAGTPARHGVHSVHGVHGRDRGGEPRVRRRGSGQAPSGRKQRVRDREIAKLVEAARADGFTPELSGGGHIKLRKGSTTVTIPSTPSDHRSAKNSRAQLRRAGVAV